MKEAKRKKNITGKQYLRVRCNKIVVGNTICCLALKKKFLQLQLIVLRISFNRERKEEKNPIQNILE